MTIVSSKIEKHCIECDILFFVYPSKEDKKFCSNKCYRSHPKPKGNNSPQYKKVTIKCDWCKKEYDEFPNKLKRLNTHLCSIKCRQSLLAKKAKERTERVTKLCGVCCKEITRTKSEFENRPSKNYYCSVECRDISKSTIHGGFTPIIKQCIACNKDFTITTKNGRTVKYCSKKCRKQNFPRGKDHNNFKPELSRDYRSRHRLTYKNTIFRTEVFERDNFKCQICLKKGEKLQAHHFENYASCKEKRFDINNGVTMCLKCHKEFHCKYGVVRNNKLQFEEFKSSYAIKS